MCIENNLPPMYGPRDLAPPPPQPKNKILKSFRQPPTGK